MFQQLTRRIERAITIDPQILSRKQATWDFKDVLGRTRGRVERGRINTYYDRKFGKYSVETDRWDRESVNTLLANPQLRRIDVVAESLFEGGEFKLEDVGSVFYPRWRPTAGPARSISYDGTIAVITLVDHAEELKGGLTLDIGGDVRFTKLLVARKDDVIEGTNIPKVLYIVRLSLVSRGVIIREDDPQIARLTQGMRDAPESVNEPAGDAQIFTTIREALAAIKEKLRIN